MPYPLTEPLSSGLSWNVSVSVTRHRWKIVRDEHCCVRSGRDEVGKTALWVSERVALIVPVVPVRDRDSSRLIAAQRNDLSQGCHHVAFSPPNPDEDANPTQVFVSESYDRDVFARGQRRRGHRLANVGLEGKRELLFQIVVPRQRTLFFGICVDDHFHLDAMFTFRVEFCLGHDVVWYSTR